LRHITKQKSPDEFEAWKDTPMSEDSDKKPTDFDKHFPSNPPKVKEEGKVYYSKYNLKTELLKEQNDLCCYCNTKIENDSKTTIEHLKPKEGIKNQHLIFDYDNLLASCNGNRKEPKPRDLHCDAEKDKDPILLTPLMPECETEIIYAENGGISGKTGRANETIKTLNLNCGKLIGERADKIFGKLYKEVIPENNDEDFVFDYNDPNNFERISPKEAEMLFNELSKTKSEPYIITILQVLKQNF